MRLPVRPPTGAGAEEVRHGLGRGKLAGRVRRRRLRRGVWVYLVLLVLSGYMLTEGWRISMRLSSAAGVVFLLLLLIGVVVVMTACFLKRHWVAGVMGALTLPMGMFAAATVQAPADSPELGIVWAVLGPLLLLLVLIFPVIGAIRSAKPGSRWATYFLTVEPDEPRAVEVVPMAGPSAPAQGTPPGWYADPEASTNWRWWTGTAWGAATGWYQDPQEPNQWRFWTGSEWTEARTAVDPSIKPIWSANRILGIVLLVAFAALPAAMSESFASDRHQWANEGVYTTGVVTGYETVDFWGAESEHTRVKTESGAVGLLGGRVGSVGDKISFSYLPGSGPLFAVLGDATNQKMGPFEFAGFFVAACAIVLAVLLLLQGVVLSLQGRRKSSKGTITRPETWSESKTA